jgi:hypothetical protein
MKQTKNTEQNIETMLPEEPKKPNYFKYAITRGILGISAICMVAITIYEGFKEGNLNTAVTSGLGAIFSSASYADGTRLEKLERDEYQARLTAKYIKQDMQEEQEKLVSQKTIDNKV